MGCPLQNRWFSLSFERSAKTGCFCGRVARTKRNRKGGQTSGRAGGAPPPVGGLDAAESAPRGRKVRAKNPGGEEKAPGAPECPYEGGVRLAFTEQKKTLFSGPPQRSKGEGNQDERSVGKKVQTAPGDQCSSGGRKTRLFNHRSAGGSWKREPVTLGGAARGGGGGIVTVQKKRLIRQRGEARRLGVSASGRSLSNCKGKGSPGRNAGSTTAREPKREQADGSTPSVRKRSAQKRDGGQNIQPIGGQRMEGSLAQNSPGPKIPVSSRESALQHDKTHRERNREK